MSVVLPGDLDPVEERRTPREIDPVIVGQTHIKNIMAFNQRTTPELKGAVHGIAADLRQDSKISKPISLAGIPLDDGELSTLGLCRVCWRLQLFRDWSES